MERGEGEVERRSGGALGGGRRWFRRRLGWRSSLYESRHVGDEGFAEVELCGGRRRWRRHRLCADQLHTGLAQLGLELFVQDPNYRLPTVTTIKVPEGVNWQAVAGHCMKK